VLRRTLVFIAALAVVMPTAAVAHVTIQTGEWEPGSRPRVVVRVPNESDTASTTKLSVQFPEEIITARFQPHPFCSREVEMAPLDEPVEDVTERIATVTWTCDPGIAPGEFDELGMSFQVPEDAAAGDVIMFPTVQTYSDGEERAWVDPDEEAESPAPRITVVAPAEEEEAAPAATSTEEAAPVPAASSGDDDDNMSSVAIGFGIAGLVAGLIALGVALFRKPKAATT
jgi:uncharacterized protein YcnI